MSNEILESIMIGKFSKRELLVLLYVFRNGYGFNREKSETELNTNRITQFTGLHRQHINETLTKLKQRNVLTLDNKTILFNRHADSWIVTKTVTQRLALKQLQNVTETVTSCNQNGDREACNPQLVSDIQPPKESLKKKETPKSPKNGDCLPPTLTKATEQIIAFLNEATGKGFKASTKGTKRLIKARFNEGYTVEDFETVINVKSEQWKGDKKMVGFLRPKTLFAAHFEAYLQESAKTSISQIAHGFQDDNTGLRGYGL